MRMKTGALLMAQLQEDLTASFTFSANNSVVFLICILKANEAFHSSD